MQQCRAQEAQSKESTRNKTQVGEACLYLRAQYFTSFVWVKWQNKTRFDVKWFNVGKPTDALCRNCGKSQRSEAYGKIKKKKKNSLETIYLTTPGMYLLTMNVF